MTTWPPPETAPSTRLATLDLVSSLTSGPRSTPASSPGPIASLLSFSANRLVAHLGQERALDGGVEVGVLEDQERGVAAEFHGAVGDGLRGRLQQHPADLGRPGEGELAHPWVGQHGADQGPGLLGAHDVHHARRHARLTQDVGHRERAQRGLLGRLEHHGAACRQGWADLAGGHGRREVLAGATEPIPYLVVGRDEKIRPDDIIAWEQSGWPEDHWRDTSPLVFINGCHTTDITPEAPKQTRRPLARSSL